MRPTFLMTAAFAFALSAALAAASGARAQTQAQMPNEPPASAPRIDVNPPPHADDTEMVKHPRGVDAEFVDKAALAGRSEVQAGRLALDRSSSPDVHAFAKRMIRDHGKANERLKQVAAQAGVPVHTGHALDPGVAALRTKRGHDFDVAYVAAAGPGPHEKVIRLFRGEARDGRDAKLRAFAKAMLPTLEAHLTAARALAQKVGAR